MAFNASYVKRLLHSSPAKYASKPDFSSFKRTPILWTKFWGLGLGFRPMVHRTFLKLVEDVQEQLLVFLYLVRLLRISPANYGPNWYASIQNWKKRKSRKIRHFQPSCVGWSWVVAKWYLPILYSWRYIFRKYLSIFCILYGFGGDSPRKYIYLYIYISSSSIPWPSRSWERHEPQHQSSFSTSDDP